MEEERRMEDQRFEDNWETHWTVKSIIGREKIGKRSRRYKQFKSQREWFREAGIVLSLRHIFLEPVYGELLLR